MWPDSAFLPPLEPYSETLLGKKKKKRRNKKKEINTEINNKIDLRNKARANKDYNEADRIRDELLDKGVLIEDKDGKTVWKFK